MRKLQEAELDLQQGDGHILYVFQDTEKYINNALAFIKTGIKMGDYILVIENERITVKLNERLKACLSPEDWKDVSFVSNFEFYYISEDFHVPLLSLHLPGSCLLIWTKIGQCEPGLMWNGAQEMTLLLRSLPLNIWQMKGLGR
nr:MEDS domain-containing protein [Thalassobacillus sp. C254]